MAKELGTHILAGLHHMAPGVMEMVGSRQPDFPPVRKTQGSWVMGLPVHLAVPVDLYMPCFPTLLP